MAFLIIPGNSDLIWFNAIKKSFLTNETTELDDLPDNLLSGNNWLRFNNLSNCVSVCLWNFFLFSCNWVKGLTVSSAAFSWDDCCCEVICLLSSDTWLNVWIAFIEFSALS